MFRLTADVLLNLGAVTNIMAANLCFQPHFEPRSTNRKIILKHLFEITVLEEVKMTQLHWRCESRARHFRFLL